MDLARSSANATRIEDNLVVSLPPDLAGELLDAVQEVVLEHLVGKNLATVVFECSAIRFIDTYEFEELRRFSQVVSALGVRPYFAGLRPEIVKYLVLNDANLLGVRAFLGLNEVLEHLSLQATQQTSRQAADEQHG